MPTLVSTRRSIHEQEVARGMDEFESRPFALKHWRPSYSARKTAGQRRSKLLARRSLTTLHLQRPHVCSFFLTHAASRGTLVIYVTTNQLRVTRQLLTRLPPDDRQRNHDRHIAPSATLPHATAAHRSRTRVETVTAAKLLPVFLASHLP